MADLRKRITELPTSTSTAGLYTLGVNAQNEGVKIPIGDLLNGLTQPTQEALKTAQAANKTAGEAKTAVETNRTELDNIIAPRLFINAKEMLSLTQSTTLATVIGALSSHKESALFKKAGLVVTFPGEQGWESWQYTFYLKNGMVPPQFDPFIETSYWRKFGGSAAVGNCFNVTNDVPLSMGYYDLEAAIAVAYDKGFRNVGMQITFAIADKSWKTYQYIGADSSEANFKNVGNWLDNAGMSAGDESFIIIDALCGPCTAAAYYTLEYAINALVAKSNATGIDYRKSGLVITYQTSENTWEAKQFTSSVGNCGTTSETVAVVLLLKRKTNLKKTAKTLSAQAVLSRTFLQTSISTLKQKVS